MRKIVCPFCKEHEVVLKKNVGCRHIYFCHKKPIETSRREAKFLYLEINWPELTTYEGLKYHYEEKLKSFPDLEAEFNISSGNIYWLLDYFDINKRTMSESNQLIGAKKSKIRWQKNYGVDNISQLKHIQDKKKATTFKNYGVDNIWKWDGYNELATKKMIELYGVKRRNNPELTSIGNKKYYENLTPEEREQKRIKNAEGNQKRWDNASQEERDRVGRQMKALWASLTDDEKNERLSKSCCLKTHISKLEIRISIILKEMNIEFMQQKRIAGKLPDFVLPNKIIIEIQGDYWHANPLKYKATDILRFIGQKPQIAQNIWDADEIKKILFESKGYRVIYIWEHEMNNKSDDELKTLIIKKLYETKIN